VLVDEVDRLCSGGGRGDLLVGAGECDHALDDGSGAELEDASVSAALGGGGGAEEYVDDG
jgi:hypothetical protein